MSLNFIDQAMWHNRWISNSARDPVFKNGARQGNSKLTSGITHMYVRTINVLSGLIPRKGSEQDLT